MTSGLRRLRNGEDLYQEWVQGCREILDLTRKQGEAIAAGDFTLLEELLQKRGQVMTRLGDLRDWGLEEGRLLLRGHWEEVAHLLQEIARLDEANRSAIAARLQTVRGDVEMLDKWRRAARAYGGGKDIPDPGVKT